MSISSVASIGPAGYPSYPIPSPCMQAGPCHAAQPGMGGAGGMSQTSLFSASCGATTNALGGMAEQVMQLLMAAFAMQAFGGKPNDEEQDKSALGLALVLAMMGQQQQGSFATSSLTYSACGQTVTPPACGGAINLMA